MPSIRPSVPVPSIARPARSTGLRAWRSRSASRGTKRRQQTISTMPIGTLTKKIPRQVQ